MPRHTRQHFSYMLKCCFKGTCYKNFTTLDNRIANAKFSIMFDYIHETSDGELIKGCPHTLLWGEFLFDYWYWLARKDFENNYTTLLDVNHNSNNKIFVNWHVSDKYKGCYGGIGITRNMVDIKVYILSRNLFFEEHFCF